jgi:hypothetical protein
MCKSRAVLGGRAQLETHPGQLLRGTKEETMTVANKLTILRIYLRELRIGNDGHSRKSNQSPHSFACR